MARLILSTRPLRRWIQVKIGAMPIATGSPAQIARRAVSARVMGQSSAFAMAVTVTLAMAFASAWLFAGAAHAQSPARTDALYRALGEKQGLVRLVDDFVNRLRGDPRIGVQFRSTNPTHLKAQLSDQLCAVSGGPCVYEGDDMKTAHAGLHISKRDFHALVEVLQQAMDAQGIPFRTQNQLLALLAPMHRDVVTVD